MASECRAKNPETCRTHGNPNLSAKSVNDESGKKEFFGEKVWTQVIKSEENSKITDTVRTSLEDSLHDIKGFSKKNELNEEEVQEKLTEVLTAIELREVEREDMSSPAAISVQKLLNNHYSNGTVTGASALATVRMFKLLKRSNELGYLTVGVFL